MLFIVNVQMQFKRVMQKQFSELFLKMKNDRGKIAANSEN